MHRIVTHRLSRLVGNFIDENDLGEVTAAETGFRLANESTIGANIGFTSNKNIE